MSKIVTTACVLLLVLFGSVSAKHGDAAPVTSHGVHAISEGQHDAEQLLRLADDARWARPIRYREVRALFLHGGVQTNVRTVSWQPPFLLRLEEDYDEGRRLLIASESGQWLHDSRHPYVLSVNIVDIPPLIRAMKLGAVTSLDDAFHGKPKDAPGRRIGRREWSFTEAHGPGNRRVYVVESDDGGARSRYWIDHEHYFPWKEEHYGPNDDLAAVIVRSDVEFAPVFDPVVFQFQRPDDAEIVTDVHDWRARTIIHDVRRRAPFPPAVPGYVPPGYAFIDGGIAAVDGKQAIHWRFYDGSHLLSVFQLVVPDGDHARRSVSSMERRRQYDADGDMLIVSAVQRGYLFLIVGQLTRDEAESMLDHLHTTEK